MRACSRSTESMVCENMDFAKKESHNVTCRTPQAEGEGFKPPIPERGIPDFESSAIDHSANLPVMVNACSKADAKVLRFIKNEEGSLKNLADFKLF